jgi:uncharacterized protein (DUF849 family)
MPCKIWIEAALNGPWGRARQPLMPIRVDEIVAQGIAATRARAAIVHFHAYDEATGHQKDNWEIYARIIDGIRAQSDAIVYPTIPLAGSGLDQEPGDAVERFRHLDELGRRGLLEWAVVDPGSVNFARHDELGRGEPGFVYFNPGNHIAEGLRLARRHGFRPSYAIYEPGFARLGAAMAGTMPGLPTPVYRLMFSDEFAWGFPPAPYALDAYLSLLGDVAPAAPWMIAGLGVDLEPLITAAVARGGHVRVGLEDARFGCACGNVTLIEAAIRTVVAAGGEPASPGDVRLELARIDRGGQA